jgi:hypothetical protein
MASPARRARCAQCRELRPRSCRRLRTAETRVQARGFLTSCPDDLGLDKSLVRKLRRRFRVSSAQHFGMFFRRGNLQCFPSHSRPGRSSGLALAAALFLSDELFHPSGDFVVFEHFSAIDLRQPFFHLTDKPFVVADQTLDSFMHERCTVATLLGSNTVQFRLYFWGKFYFHGFSVRAVLEAVKVFASFLEEPTWSFTQDVNEDAHRTRRRCGGCGRAGRRAWQSGGLRVRRRRAGFRRREFSERARIRRIVGRGIRHRCHRR